MHTAHELKRSMITLEKAGAPAGREDVLDWELRDRLGVVVTSPLGALGAGLLILLCTTAFYDQEARRRRRPLYAPIYLFHVGRGWGFHGEFDFWPDRKELIVADAAQILPQINSHGITHLAVPHADATAVLHRYKEPEELLDRLKQAFVYSPTGSLGSHTLRLETTDDSVIRNFIHTVNLPETLALREGEVRADPTLQRDTVEGIDARRYVQIMRTRLTEIDYAQSAASGVRERVWQAMRNHHLAEELAEIEPKDALGLLG